MNHLFDAIYKTPLTREMYLRRLRTLMDELLQPPGTAPNQRLLRSIESTRCGRLAERRRPRPGALGRGLWSRAKSDHRHHRPEERLPHTAPGASLSNPQRGQRRHLPAGGGHSPRSDRKSPCCSFGATEFNPSSGNQAQEYVELLNPNPVAVDISGWRIEGGIDFTLHPWHGRPGQWTRLFVARPRGVPRPHQPARGAGKDCSRWAIIRATLGPRRNIAFVGQAEAVPSPPTPIRAIPAPRNDICASRN